MIIEKLKPDSFRLYLIGGDMSKKIMKMYKRCLPIRFENDGCTAILQADKTMRVEIERDYKVQPSDIIQDLGIILKRLNSSNSKASIRFCKVVSEWYYCASYIFSVGEVPNTYK